MSIEIVGPDKYSFQDLVCVDLMLRFVDDPDLRLIVEPLGGEDALVVVHWEDSQWSIEVQVKGSAQEVSPRTIAECLAHFPPRKAADCLLDRLISDSSRLTLLVMSGRCVDLASPFVVEADWSGKRRKLGSVKKAATDAVLKNFRRPLRKGSSPLEQKRNKHREQILKTASLADWRRAAHKLFVLERVSKDFLFNRCKESLRDRYLIPADRTPDVTKLLCDAVAEGKTERNDVATALRAVIERFAVTSLAPLNYVHRGDEPDWIVSLSNDNVLLLSGPPRCGKTDAAHYVAAEFQRLGYKVRQGSDIDEARRYLLEPTADERLYLLDDPLGSLHVEPNVVRVVGNLRSVVARLTHGRKLIVAQSQDQLFVATGARSLSECSIGNDVWRDLGSPRSSFLVSVWNSMISDVTISSGLMRTVCDSIVEGDRLEVGNIRHLASSVEQLVSTSSRQAIIRKAREDASDLGRELSLSHPGMHLLLAALAISTTSQEPIQIPELALLTDTSDSPLPGLSSVLDGGISVFGPKGPTPRFPTYENVPRISADILANLDQLERRLFVQRTSTGIRFSHPYYRAAAESVLIHATEQSASTAIRIVRKGISCLSPRTTRAVARNLEWLFEYLRSSNQYVEELIDEASAGLNSIFPATRDLCLSFLIRHAEDFESSRVRLSEWVRSDLSIRLDELEWRDGEAWIPRGLRSGLDLLERELTVPARSDIQEDLRSASSGASETLSPERAARLLKFLKYEPESMSSLLALRMLGFDEAPIRAETAYIWLATPRTSDSDTLLRIFEDTHPRVLLAAYKALVRGWKALDPDRRELILGKLLRAAESASVAIAILPQLIVFDRVEHTGKNPPWTLFARLLPVVLRKLPANSRFDKARLFNSAQVATEHVMPKEVAEIGSAWIGWLQRVIAIRLPDDFEFGVCDIIVTGTAKDPEARAGLVQRLLNFNQTAPLLCFIKDLVDSWSLLTEEERQLLTDLLSQSRQDQSWLHGVVITRKDVPPKLQNLILGSDDILTRGALELVNEIPPTLLQAAISVYCGNPQPLWWLGTQRSGGKFAEILEVLEKRPDHPLFEMALWRTLLSPDDEHVRDIVNNAGPPNAERLFRYFLRYKVDCTGNWLPKTWSAILRLAPDTHTLEFWFDELARCAPAILDRLSDVRMWLVEKEDSRSLLLRLEADVEAEFLMQRVHELPAEQRKAVVQSLRRVALSGRIRLFGTYDRLKRALKAYDDTFGTIERDVGSARDSAFKTREGIEEEMGEETSPPADWVS